MRSVRLLHITDLHLTPNGQPEYGDFKVEDPGLREHLLGDEARSFIQRLINELGREDDWPKLIVVTGDLVERGGSIPGEMEAASAFLFELSQRLRIMPDRVFVVPGNHDVDWTPGKTIKERFENFRRAMKPFTTPSFEAEGPQPQFSVLPKLVDGIEIEILLLVSPTFSGVPDPDANRVFERIHDTLSDWSKDQLSQLRSALKAATGHVDIAAIGAEQLDFVRRLRTAAEPGPIRIAALHHHLLPDPQMEVATFESVLDAGRVLDALLDRDFDLVLTGHKHNRRLVHYARRERDSNRDQRVIDVYSGPSLFKTTHVSNPGFTIVEIFGSDSPAYAKLEYRATNDACIIGKPLDLTREGRVMSTVISACAKIPLIEQESIARPALENMVRIVDWMHEAEGLQDLLQDAWDALSGDIARMGNREILFRPPQLHLRWRQLIEVAQRSAAPELRLVSKADVEYWCEAKDDPMSEAFFYESPVRAFAGRKKRILIFNRFELGEHDNRQRAADVVAWMQDGGIEVSALFEHDAPAGVPLDFGVIAEIAVSEFVRRTPSRSRALKESFGQATLDRYAHHWDTLNQTPRMWRHGVSTFALWAEQLKRPRGDGE